MVDKPQWLVRGKPGSRCSSRSRCVSAWDRIPASLPTLRDHPLRAFDDGEADDALERQWRAYWEIAVEPETPASATPLELIDGFDTIVALPAVGAERLCAPRSPPGGRRGAVRERAQQRYTRSVSGTGDPLPGVRGGAHGVRARHRAPRALFELNVHVLPLVQRGIWRIGAFSVAVTDSLRRPVDFDTAIRHHRRVA